MALLRILKVKYETTRRANQLQVMGRECMGVGCCSLTRPLYRTRVECPLSCTWARRHPPINADWVQVQVCPSKSLHALNKSHASQCVILKWCQIHKTNRLHYLHHASCILLCPRAFKRWILLFMNHVAASILSLALAVLQKKKEKSFVYLYFIVLKVDRSWIKTL